MPIVPINRKLIVVEMDFQGDGPENLQEQLFSKLEEIPNEGITVEVQNGRRNLVRRAVTVNNES